MRSLGLLFLGGAVVSAYTPNARPSRRAAVGAAATSLLVSLPARAAKSRDGYEVQHTVPEWRAGLSEQQFFVLREGGTEPPFTSPLVKEKGPGTFRCAACDAALFAARDKFDSGTGWPSFARALPAVEVLGGPGGVAQTAVLGAECRCGRCGGHLGDLFLDGFLFVGSQAMLSGKRYCIDGAALTFAPEGDPDNRVYGEGCVVGKRCIASKGTLEEITAARTSWT
jgi:peptide-methionine (R)-S-oxide reductase